MHVCGTPRWGTERTSQQLILCRFAFAGVHQILLHKDRCRVLPPVAVGMNHHDVKLSLARERHVVLYHDATPESLHHLCTVQYGCDEHLPYMMFGGDAAQDTASPATHTVATARVQSYNFAVTIGRRVSLGENRRCTLHIIVHCPYLNCKLPRRTPSAPPLPRSHACLCR